MRNHVKRAFDTTVELGTTTLGVIAGFSAVNPEVGIVTQGVSALVGGVIGRFVGGAITNRISE